MFRFVRKALSNLRRKIIEFAAGLDTQNKIAEVMPVGQWMSPKDIYDKYKQKFGTDPSIAHLMNSLDLMKAGKRVMQGDNYFMRVR
jgi:hypothetical protein